MEKEFESMKHDAYELAPKMRKTIGSNVGLPVRTKRDKNLEFEETTGGCTLVV